MNNQGFDRATAFRWVAVVPLSLLLGWLFSRWHVPAAWILAGIIAAGASSLLNGNTLPVNRTLYTFGAGIVGIMAGIPLVGESLDTLVSFLLPGLMVAAMTISIGLTGGLLLARSQKEISRETGALSMLAGGAAFMPAIAEEIGADTRYVALTQYLRLLAVALSLPIVTSFLSAPLPRGPEALSAGEQPWWIVLAVIAMAVGGGPLAKLLRLPVPAILGPLALSIGVSLLLPQELSLQPPETLRIIAFLSIGWLCGGTLSMASLKLFGHQLPITLTFIAILIGACALFAYPLAGWLDISYYDAYLSTSPGAMDTVLAISSETGTSPEVVAIQLIRLILILLVAASLPRVIRFITRS
ncbi:AbrB family transcriptional regulator [Corynebacterium sp. A21]|uniref:AbrB family transcriptional regulator n=1 Tax=Corynebacterium sp. A21 TaxID=3457318 RepID=UPI003FD5B05D